MKLCKDCKYQDGGKCAKGAPDYVTGGVRDLLFNSWRQSCNLQREDGWLTSRINHTCGQSARWFEAK